MKHEKVNMNHKVNKHKKSKYESHENKHKTQGIKNEPQHWNAIKVNIKHIDNEDK